MVGSTPIHTFTLPFDISGATNVVLIYSQDYKEVFKKEMQELTISGDTISLILTQEDTFKFNPDRLGQVQVSLLIDGNPKDSDVVWFKIKRNLRTEVLM